MSQQLDVLIIEDDTWLAAQFERTLDKQGFKTHITTNAPAAMDIIDEQAPRVIVLDMLLGGTTGLTLLHELQTYTDTAQTPVILCTNLASTLKLVDVQPYGVRRILDKTTMHPDDIAVAVKSLLP